MLGVWRALHSASAFTGDAEIAAGGSLIVVAALCGLFAGLSGSADALTSGLVAGVLLLVTPTFSLLGLAWVRDAVVMRFDLGLFTRPYRRVDPATALPAVVMYAALALWGLVEGGRHGLHVWFGAVLALFFLMFWFRTSEVRFFALSAWVQAALALLGSRPDAVFMVESVAAIGLGLAASGSWALVSAMREAREAPLLGVLTSALGSGEGPRRLLALTSLAHRIDARLFGPLVRIAVEASTIDSILAQQALRDLWGPPLRARLTRRFLEAGEPLTPEDQGRVIDDIDEQVRFETAELRSRADVIRRVVAHVLEADPSVLDPLLALAAGASGARPYGQAAAIRYVAQLDDDRARNALVALLSAHLDLDVARVLQVSFADVDPCVAARLGALVTDERAWVRNRALMALGTIAGRVSPSDEATRTRLVADAGPAVSAALVHRDSVTRAAALRFVGLMSPDGTGAVVEALSDPSPFVRAEAVRVVSATMEDRAAPYVAAALKDARAQVRLAAVRSVIALELTDYLPDMIGMTADGVGEVEGCARIAVHTLQRRLAADRAAVRASFGIED